MSRGCLALNEKVAILVFLGMKYGVFFRFTRSKVRRLSGKDRVCLMIPFLMTSRSNLRWQMNRSSNIISRKVSNFVWPGNNWSSISFISV